MIMTGAIKKEKKWRESIWKTWQKNRGWKEGMRAWRILLHLILYYYVLCFLVLSGLTLYGPVSLCPLYFELKPSYPILSYLFLRPISFHSITPNPIPSYPILFYLFHLIRFILSYLSRLIFEGSVIENTRRRVASEKGFCSICCRINCPD